MHASLQAAHPHIQQARNFVWKASIESNTIHGRLIWAVARRCRPGVTSRAFGLDKMRFMGWYGLVTNTIRLVRRII